MWVEGLGCKECNVGGRAGVSRMPCGWKGWGVKNAMWVEGLGCKECNVGGRAGV